MIEILATASLRSLAVAALAGVLLSVFRVRDAALRHACWAGVLAALVLMPLLTGVLPSLELPVLPSTATGRADVAIRTVEAVAPPAAPAASWRTALLGIYGLVALALLAHRGLGYCLGVRLVRSARPLGSLARSRKPEVRYLESADLSVPVTFGWLRPAVLLPKAFRHWKPQKLEAVLAHEEAHIRRHDFAIGALASISRAVFWIHPLAWWLERRLSALAEQAADDVAAGADRQRYAQILVGLAGEAGAGRVTGLAVAGQGGLRGRVERLLDPRYMRMTRPGPYTVALTMALLAVLTLLSASVEVTEARSRPGEGLQVAAHGAEPPTNLITEEEPNASGQLGTDEEWFRSWLGRPAVAISEEERRAFGQLGTDEERRRFIVQFWLRRRALEAAAPQGPEPPRPVVREPEPQGPEPQGPGEAQEPEEAADPVQPGAGVTAPRVLSRVSAEYSEVMREARAEGTVIVEAVVRKDGTLEIVRVVRTPEGFGEEVAGSFATQARTALSQWRFEPATRNGEPVDVALNIEVNFSLE